MESTVVEWLESRIWTWASPLDRQSPDGGRGGLSFGKAYFLAQFYFVYPGIINKWGVAVT